MKPGTRISIAVAIWLLGLPPTVAAQDGPRGEIAGGYQYMWDKELEESFPTGWFVSGGGYITSRLALVGEIAASQKTESDADFEASFSLHTYLGGARVMFAGPSSTVRPFAQFLAGAARATATVDVAGMRIDESLTELAIQPGGGVDIRLTDSIWARAMVDYRRTLFEEADGNEVRVAAGVVVTF